MKGTEVFVHTDLFVEKASGLFLPLVSWRLLHALDGLVDVETLGVKLQITYPKMVQLIEELQAEGWIEEQTLSLEEFEEFLNKQPAEKNGEAGDQYPYQPKSPEQLKTVGNKRQARVLKVSKVIEFLNGQAASPLEAQATAYLVFSRLPAATLEKAGITKIALLNDATEIESPELQSALSNIIFSIVQKRMPDSLYE